ncbi:MAG TPA: hypothetical protein DCM05_04330 [Elusimicrobia bacterium]|nr:hypothetical protein [Elusimicrobiota bacterium]
MEASEGPALRSAPGLGASFLACALLAAGLSLGNPSLVYAAAAFAFVLAADVASIAFASVRADMRLSHASLSRGEEFRIVVDVESGGGLGLVYVQIPLPKEFSLKAGNNFRVRFLLPWTRRRSYRLSVAALSRGEFLVGPPEIRIVSLWGEFSRSLNGMGDAVKVSVWPRHHLIKRFKELRAFGRTPLPDNSIAFLGMRSNSLNGLREYHPGDSARMVNWRASAKMLSGGASRLPLVNEYSVEGKKAVWLFIDSSPATAVGTREENPFEYFLESALSITSYFISRGYKVGASVFANDVLVRSDSGRGQIAKVLREFVRVKPAAYPEKLTYAVESVRPFLAADRPLCFILTRPEVDCEGTSDAIRRLQAILGRRSTVCLVAVKWTEWHPRQTLYGGFAAKAMDAKIEAAFKLVRGAGAIPILWDPRTQRFGGLLVRAAAGLGRSR